MSNLIGQSLGRYHILEQLGEGGMAIVYKAYDTRLERDVAVKIIRTDAIPQNAMERSLKRFEREAKALARLTHPNIVKVTDYGEHEGKPYLVMPYLPGGTLKSKLSDKPMPWLEAVRILIPIADALGYAHEHEIIHRDVKPSNILITENGQPMLADFGVAKLLDAVETMELTGTGVGIGTPEYMAPEQVTGKLVDARADIYALGVVLFEMVTGRKPFIADTPMAVLFKHASDPLPRPRQFVPDLPQAVENVIIKSLAKKLENRFQNMAEFVKAMEGLCSGKKFSAPKADEVPVREKRAEFKLPVSSRHTLIRVGIIALVIGLLAVFYKSLSALPVQLFATSTASNSPTPVFTPTPILPTSTPIPPILTTIPPTPTTSPQVEQARAFAEPILAVIAQRRPDYEDDFSKVNPGWKLYGFQPGDGDMATGKFAIEDGVARFQLSRGQAFISKDSAIAGKDFVLQLEFRLVSGDTSSNIMISIHNASQAHMFNIILNPALQAWDVNGRWGSDLGIFASGTDHLSPVGGTTQVTVIARGSKFALYLDQSAEAFGDDPNFDNAGSTLLLCKSVSPAVCEFDNVKFWDLAKVSGLP
jgi:serine/threonine protein kinase